MVFVWRLLGAPARIHHTETTRIARLESGLRLALERPGSELRIEYDGDCDYPVVPLLGVARRYVVTVRNLSDTKPLTDCQLMLRFTDRTFRGIRDVHLEAE